MIGGIHRIWASAIDKWPLARVRDHFSILNGFPFSSDKFNKEGRGLPLIRIRDIITGQPEIFYDGIEGQESLLKDGDIVVGMDGDFNVGWWKHGPALLNQRLCALRPKGKLHPRFAFYQLPIALRVVNDLTPASTVKHLSSFDVLSIRLPYPDQNEQFKIYTFLDHETARIDQLIAKNTRFSQLIQERHTAKIADAILGMAGDADTWLAELPVGWKAERAKFHFRESQHRSETGEEELLTVSHITGVTRRADKDVNMFLAESNAGYKLVEPGDLVINTMWAWMGAMGVSSERGLISPSYGVYRPNSGALRPAFVDLLVRSKPFVAEATRRSKGIHSSRLRLYPDAYLDMRLPIPPLHRQDEILGKVASITTRENELLRKIAHAIELLREHRAALITAAVTGQIDVATWGKRGETDRCLDRIEKAIRA